MSITNKGIIFSMDALVAFIIVLFLIMVFVIHIGNQQNQITQNIGQFFLEEKTILIADSLIKNYNSENTLLGSCIYNVEKKRVKSNEINTTNFSGFKPIEQDNFFVKSVSYQTPTKKEKWLVENKKGECLVVKRFAIINGKNGMIFVEGCTSE